MFDATAIGLLMFTGLVAGVLGGMLGIGGSIIMIPAMVVLFGQGTREPGFNQHLYQAAAMIVNVFVAAPALARHIKARAVLPAVLKWMLPVGLLCILAGVMVSNLPVFHGNDGPLWLGRIMAAFLLYETLVNVKRLIRPAHELPGDQRITPARCGAAGAGMGFVGGLLGVGGGILAVPLQQLLMRLPLRNCIANSTAVMVVTATVGAAMKNSTLPPECTMADSLTLAAILIPTAFAGGYVGGSLSHRLPLQVVRVAYILLMVAAAWKMSGL